MSIPQGTPLEKILVLLENARPTGDGKWLACCPAHQDHSPSLSISTGDDGRVLLHCFAGCKPKAIVSALNLTMSDLFSPSTNGKHKGSGKVGGKSYPTAEKAWKAVGYAICRQHPGTRVNKLWPYQDSSGNIVAYVVRWDMPDGSKEYRPISLHADDWRIKDLPGLWPLYEFPTLLTEPSAPVYVVEGEKCADAARAIGMNATTSQGGANAPTKTDWAPLVNRDVIILPDHDPAGEQYAHAVTAILFSINPATKVKLVTLPGLGDGEDIVEFIGRRREDGKDDTAIVCEIKAMTAQVSFENAPNKDKASSNAQKAGEQREQTEHGENVLPEIVIGTDEHRVNAAAAEALTADANIYQRGGILVRIVRDASPAAKGIRRPLSPRIEALPVPLLRERLTAVATWKAIHLTKNGAEVRPAHPPSWCVSAVHAHANWTGIRHLESVVDYPVLRPDGTILTQNGYDPDTGLMLDTTCDIDQLPARPTHGEAIAARDRLFGVVMDFPFERPVHKAAWLAALLTPLSRFAFSGPSPLFLVDANVRAAGKGLLLDCIARIITGERFTIATYTHDEDELRKRITSLAMSAALSEKS